MELYIRKAFQGTKVCALVRFLTLVFHKWRTKQTNKKTTQDAPDHYPIMLMILLTISDFRLDGQWEDFVNERKTATSIP